MPALDPFAYVLAGVIALAGPLSGPFERRVYRSDPPTPRKLAMYGAIVAMLWGLTAGAVRIDGWGRLLRSPVTGTAWPSAPALVGLLLGVAVAAYFALALLPLAQSLRGPRWRGAYATAIRRGFSDIPGLLPRNAIERAAFALVSLSAGICEEVLFRGFLMRFLHEGGLAMPHTGALVVSSLVFGLGHAYQGPKGVVSTTVAGIGLGLLFLLSGSLIPGIVLHVLIDLQMSYVLSPIRGDTTARAAETDVAETHRTASGRR
jgi:membrane protease YdiL (CAAX protease family)